MQQNRKISIASATFGLADAVGADRPGAAGACPGLFGQIHLARAGRWTAFAVYLLAKRPMPGSVPRAVGALIAGISLVDAALMASVGAVVPASMALIGFGRRSCCKNTSRGLEAMMVEVITKPRGPIAAEPAEIIDLLLGWLSRRITPEAMNWLVAEVDRQRAGPDERRVAMALGLSGRKVGPRNCC